MKRTFFFWVLVCSFHASVFCQLPLRSLAFSSDSLSVDSLVVGNEMLRPGAGRLPLASFVLDGRLCYTDRPGSFGDRLRVRLSGYRETAQGIAAIITFRNTGKDTLQLENIVPFGEGADRVYITGRGRHALSRTYIFIPGRQPVNVIVPDNAWDLGFCSVEAKGGRLQITALARRDRSGIKNGSRTRFETKLFPGGSVDYKFYAEAAEGDWHAALQRIFQERMLYDVEKFDGSLLERRDLRWVRHAYVSHLMMNWNRWYYDYADGKFHMGEFLQRGKRLYGGDDFVGIWPTWPTLGLDQRNQFDLFRDLPGGTAGIKQIAAASRSMGTRFFVCYNPWDESTRNEDHFEGISRLIASTSADGMVLDTKGESRGALQAAADKVRKGVVLYSEGMATPKDMSGIVSGRVHNALYYPPMLNLNKFIMPGFAIFRVAEIYREPIRREFATAFFNGYGTEINIMAPGEPDWVEAQYKYLGRTSRILRENTDNFTARGYTPLVETASDSIWVNEWALPAKTIYTIYSVRPEGYNDYLFPVKPGPGYHFADLWHHRLLTPKMIDGKWWIKAETDAFNRRYLGTNNEGAVDCIARLPMLISAQRNGDSLIIGTAKQGDELRIWAGQPAYGRSPVILRPGQLRLSLHVLFGRYEGDFVIQLLNKGILLDEQVLTLSPGEPRRVSSVRKTKRAGAAPPGMVKIPSGRFHFMTTNGDAFIPYPKQDIDSVFEMTSFFADKFPVTNVQYLQFIKATGYRPADTVNYLRHWSKGRIPAGMGNFPVIYISYEDARAYAAWAGKRLPTEIEWQYAAQTSDQREWPWKQLTPVRGKEQVITETLTVSVPEGIDSSRCNPGDGRLYAVGRYPAGANPFGLQDLTGCVWQLTNDLYMCGDYRYVIMKGGSYYKPSGSWWYVQGGPRALPYRQFLLRVSQGFERNATVGFRCVKDAK